MTQIDSVRMADLLRGLQLRLEEGLPYKAFEDAHPEQRGVPQELQDVARAGFDSGYQSALTDAMRLVAKEIGA